MRSSTTDGATANRMRRLTRGSGSWPSSTNTSAGARLTDGASPMVPRNRGLSALTVAAGGGDAGLMYTVEAVPARADQTTAQVLVASHLGKRFGDRVAVDDVTFEVAAGETYGLLGPNGAGKTTTIRLVCGLLAPDAGQTLIAGRRVSPTATQAKKFVGYVPQEIALYPDLTARENLKFFGRLYGLHGNALNRR